MNPASPYHLLRPLLFDKVVTGPERLAFLYFKILVASKAELLRETPPLVNGGLMMMEVMNLW